MKRKIAFALVSIALGGGAWSCFSLAQDPFGPARLSRETVTRTLNELGGVESVTLAGGDMAPTNLSIAKVANRQEEIVVALVMQLKSVEGAERESVVAKLKSAVGEQFDHRQESKMKELKALEEQLARLKEIHNKRTQQREQIIGDRLQQLIREVDGLGWGTDVSERSIFGRTNAAVEEISRTRSAGASLSSPPPPPAKPLILERRATSGRRD